MSNKSCSVINCDSANPRIRKGLCNKHYKRVQQNGDLYLHSERESTPKATQSPEVRDIAWAAGFCEGEGTFQNSTVALPQTNNLDCLIKLQRLFGGSITDRTFPNGGFTNSKPQKLWKICGSRARGFMMTIYPFMGTRRQGQIRKALNINKEK